MRCKPKHRSRFRWIAELLRMKDRRHERYPVVLTDYQAMLLNANQRYRDRTSHIRQEGL